VYPTVLMMLSLDDHGGPVVEAFLSLAGRLGVQRVVVFGVRARDPLPAVLAAQHPAVGPQPPASLEKLVDAIRAALPDVSVDVRVEAGNPVVLLDRAQEELSPDLVVLGRPSDKAEAMAWGAAGRNMVRHSRSCVLLIPEGWHPPVHGAVVGIDFSSEASQALAVAARLFDQVTGVFQYNPALSGHPGMTEAEFAEDLEHNARTYFTRDLAPVAGATPVSLELVAESKAWRALVDHAGTSRVLVIGSRGLSPLAAMLLGSTAEHVAQSAQCPVFIVRKKGDVMGVIDGLVHR